MTPRAVSLAIRATLLAALLAAAGPVQAQQSPARTFDPVGRWRFFHADGTPFIVRLAADQSATSTGDVGQHGIWRWEGNAVRVIYTDGWDDFLAVGAEGGFVNRGSGPDSDRCGPAANQTKAERISTEPGPPL